MFRFQLAIAVLGLAAAGTAQATTLFPQSVTVNYTHGAQVTQDVDVPIGPSVEITCTGNGSGSGTGTTNICSILTRPTQTLDFDDQPDRLVITYTYIDAGLPAAAYGTEPNFFNFAELNFELPIYGVSILSSIAGLDDSRVSFTANSVTVNMADLPEPTLNSGDYFRLEIYTTPEPSSWMLAGLGTLALFALRRTRKRTPL